MLLFVTTTTTQTDTTHEIDVDDDNVHLLRAKKVNTILFSCRIFSHFDFLSPDLLLYLTQNQYFE